MTRSRRLRTVWLSVALVLAVGAITFIVRGVITTHRAHSAAQSVASSVPTAPAVPSTTATSTTAPPTTAPPTTVPPTTVPPTTAPVTTPAPLPANPALANSAVAAADAFNNNDDGGQYAVAVYDRANNNLVLGKYGTMPMMSASVIKLYVIVDLLHQREQGTITLGSDDVELIRRSLSGSDDNAMDVLWSKYNGMQALQQIIELAGLQQTAVPTDPAQWGEATISASDTISVYRYLLTSLTPADRTLVLTDLSHPTHYGLADNFDQDFGLLGPGVRPKYVAAKQGWIGYRPYRYLHTTGLVGSRDQYIAVVLTRQSDALSYPDVSANVTAAAGALLKGLGPAGIR